MEPVIARVLESIDAIHADESISLTRTLVRLETIYEHTAVLIEAVKLQLDLEPQSHGGGP